MMRTRWPLHPEPVEGEALSSWLRRVAEEYNIQTECLLKYDLGYDISLDSLDLNPPVSLLENIVKRSHLTLEQLHHMTFNSFVPFIIDNSDPIPNSFPDYIHNVSLLLPTKAHYNREPRYWQPWISSQSTIRVCQYCLELAPNRPVHLSWKLSIMISCPIHFCRLKSCVVVSSKYVLFRENDAPDNIITKEIIDMDARTSQALISGKVDLPNQTIHAGVWFRLLRSLIHELSQPLPSSPNHRDRIKHIWNKSGHRVRAGINQWKTYEQLSIDKQIQILEASATAMALIENGEVEAPGESSKFFISEPINSKDWPSYPKFDNEYCPSYRRSIQNNNNLSLMELVEQAISEAKTNLESAKQLRSFCLFGRTDEKTVREIDSLFLELDIPLRLM